MSQCLHHLSRYEHFTPQMSSWWTCIVVLLSGPARGIMLQFLQLGFSWCASRYFLLGLLLVSWILFHCFIFSFFIFLFLSKQGFTLPYKENKSGQTIQGNRKNLTTLFLASTLFILFLCFFVSTFFHFLLFLFLFFCFSFFFVVIYSNKYKNNNFQIIDHLKQMCGHF